MQQIYFRRAFDVLCDANMHGKEKRKLYENRVSCYDSSSLMHQLYFPSRKIDGENRLLYSCIVKIILSLYGGMFFLSAH